MKEPYISVAQDPTMPEGRCLVVRISDHAIIYTGRIGGLTEAILNQEEGAVLILHPIDFADGERFMKATRH